MRAYQTPRSAAADRVAPGRGALAAGLGDAFRCIAEFSGHLPFVLIALVFPACVIQAPPPLSHVQYPVVAASETETFAGTVDNNLMNGTAYVDLQAADSDARCRGEGHLIQGPASTCVGGQGACNLTCDDGMVIACRYQLASCVSGYGVGLNQDLKWFAFSFGPRMSGLEGQEVTAKLKTFVAGLPSAVPPKEARKKKGYLVGTGFFVSREGYVVSAYHVIEDAHEVKVVLRSGDILTASVKGIDEANDIALLKVARSAKPLAVVSSKNVAVGDEVFTVGYPLIDIEGQEQKTTFGHVNALSGIQDDVRFVQMDAAIQPGNSGGPLLDSRGRVVGVVAETLDPAALLKAAGTVPQNANYAVKSDYVLPLMIRYEIQPAGGLSATAGKEAEIVRRIRDSVVLVVAR
ncbi:MAG: S1C family serine protease [Candidatus Binataceae bacterium]